MPRFETERAAAARSRRRHSRPSEAAHDELAVVPRCYYPDCNRAAKWHLPKGACPRNTHVAFDFCDPCRVKFFATLERDGNLFAVDARDRLQLIERPLELDAERLVASFYVELMRGGKLTREEALTEARALARESLDGGAA